MISIIVAMAQNRVIGKDNKMPWHLSEDLRHFKQTTMGHTVIMGRKTFESIGKPLPGRTNVVLTRNKNFSAPQVQVMSSLEDLKDFQESPKEVFVIGGAELYKQVLPLVKKIYLTLILKDFDGNAYFPVCDWEKDFKKIEETQTLLSPKENLPYKFIVMERC